jgi:hypothetical protein
MEKRKKHNTIRSNIIFSLLLLHVWLEWIRENSAPDLYNEAKVNRNWWNSSNTISSEAISNRWLSAKNLWFSLFFVAFVEDNERKRIVALILMYSGRRLSEMKREGGGYLMKNVVVKKRRESECVRLG